MCIKAKQAGDSHLQALKSAAVALLYPAHLSVAPKGIPRAASVSELLPLATCGDSRALCIVSGPIDATGHVRIQITFDHLVMDAANTARCLTEMEQSLRGPILEELVRLPAATSVGEALASLIDNPQHPPARGLDTW